jgi:hypothetical protein
VQWAKPHECCVGGDARINGVLRPKNRIDLSFEEITGYLNRGLMQIHKFPLGFVITEIKQLQNERIVHVVWLGGERFSEWQATVVAHLKKFGKEHGCVAIEAHCRPGLAKLLKPTFRTIKTTVRADI